MITRRPREFYERLYNWALDTPLPDAISGRFLEWTWHLIWGDEQARHPSAVLPHARAIRSLSDYEAYARAFAKEHGNSMSVPVGV